MWYTIGCKLPLFALALLAIVWPIAFGHQPLGPESRHSPSLSGLHAYRDLPLAFEANRGPAGIETGFVARGLGYTTSLSAAEFGFNSTRRAEVEDARSIRVRLVGGDRRARGIGLEPLTGSVNYFIGADPAQWRTRIVLYAKAMYHNVFPGVDVVYYGNSHQLELDFVVAPGADPGRIAVGIPGARPQLVNGGLFLRTAAGTVCLRQPLVYQVIAGTRHLIAAHFAIDKRLGRIRVGSYDHSRPLIIDPTIAYSTLLGGRDDDAAYAVAVDRFGSVYVTGNTTSRDFPLSRPFQRRHVGSPAVFVAKLSADGSHLVYATYLGGDDADVGYGIAVDSAGNAYVTGDTRSTDFPLANPVQPKLGGAADVFITKLSPDGARLLYSTYLGGSGGERGQGIAVDATGNAYVTGYTNSTDFPTLNALQPTFGGGNADAFVVKVNATGSLVYSTYLGGGNDRPDIGTAIAADDAGSAYVTGFTNSRDFPTARPLQSFRGPTDAFVTKINPTGSALVYSTHLGGSADDEAMGIAIDAAGSAYVTGHTESPDFPTTPGAFREHCTAIAAQLTIGNICQGGDAFVSKLTPDGSALAYSTFLSGSGFEVGRSIAIDSTGSAFVTGITNSADFPTVDAIQPVYGGGDYDAFVVRLDPSGHSLLYSTFLGGPGEDGGYGIAVDDRGNAYVAGYTQSHSFPVRHPLVNVYPKVGGGSSAFITKIATEPPPR